MKVEIMQALRLLQQSMTSTFMAIYSLIFNSEIFIDQREPMRVRSLNFSIQDLPSCYLQSI